MHVHRHQRKALHAREGLEFHHRSPYGRDGDHGVDNLCLMCHAHNAYLAELEYGRDRIDLYRRSGNLVREKRPDYGANESYLGRSIEPASLAVAIGSQ
jgi:hypothetical protein